MWPCRSRSAAASADMPVPSSTTSSRRMPSTVSSRTVARVARECRTTFDSSSRATANTIGSTGSGSVGAMSVPMSMPERAELAAASWVSARARPAPASTAGCSSKVASRIWSVASRSPARARSSASSGCRLSTAVMSWRAISTDCSGPSWMYSEIVRCWSSEAAIRSTSSSCREALRWLISSMWRACAYTASHTVQHRNAKIAVASVARTRPVSASITGSV